MRSLTLRQLPSHLDPEFVFSRLPRLERLTLSYGAHGMGVRVPPGALGINAADAERLAGYLASTKTLTHLSLAGSRLTDETLALLAPGLAACASLTHLDLSLNALSSAGVAASLAPLLRCGTCGITHLDLHHCNLDGHAGLALGGALVDNVQARRPLRHLNLRLNTPGLQDTGGAELLSGVAKGASWAEKAQAAASAAGRAGGGERGSGGGGRSRSRPRSGTGIATSTVAPSATATALAAPGGSGGAAIGGGLTHLDLSFNRAGNATAAALVHALNAPACRLVEVLLAGNSLTPSDITAVEQAVCAHASEVTVDLRENGGNRSGTAAGTGHGSDVHNI